MMYNWIKEPGLADRGVSSLYREQSPGCKYPGETKWTLSAHFTNIHTEARRKGFAISTWVRCFRVFGRAHSHQYTPTQTLPHSRLPTVLLSVGRGELHTAVCCGHASLHSHRRYIRVPLPPYPLWYLLPCVSFMTAIPTGVKGIHNVALVSLMAKDIEHFSNINWPFVFSHPGRPCRCGSGLSQPWYLLSPKLWEPVSICTGTSLPKWPGTQLIFEWTHVLNLQAFSPPPSNVRLFLRLWTTVPHVQTFNLQVRV